MQARRETVERCAKDSAESVQLPALCAILEEADVGVHSHASRRNKVVAMHLNDLKSVPGEKHRELGSTVPVFIECIPGSSQLTDPPFEIFQAMHNEISKEIPRGNSDEEQSPGLKDSSHLGECRLRPFLEMLDHAKRDHRTKRAIRKSRPQDIANLKRYSRIMLQSERNVAFSNVDPRDIVSEPPQVEYPSPAPCPCFQDRLVLGEHSAKHRLDGLQRTQRDVLLEVGRTAKLTECFLLIDLLDRRTKFVWSHRVRIS
jgi:hypothetical protein